MVVEQLYSALLGSAEPSATPSPSERFLPVRLRLSTLISTIGLLCAFLALEGCYSRAVQQDPRLLQAVNPQSGNIESAFYIIRQGDHIKISAIDYMEFDTTAVVSENGTVSLKLIGEVHVDGLTRTLAEKAIADRIGVYAKSQAVIVSIGIVKGIGSQVVMLGSIARPDTFGVTTPISLLESLAIAGGTDELADLRRIKIYRRDVAGPPLEFDLLSFIASGNIREIPMIGPGDMVYVPREENFIREFSVYLRDTLFLFGFFSIAR